jgi:hypothetical protein
MRATQQRHGWEKPPEDFVKLNVGATFSADNVTGGTGLFSETIKACS